MAQQFQKKPLAIEAVQYTGDNEEEIRKFCPGVAQGHNADLSLSIPTLQGLTIVLTGYWIIREDSKFHLCHPEAFEQMYELKSSEA